MQKYLHTLGALNQLNYYREANEMLEEKIKRIEPITTQYKNKVVGNQPASQ